MEKIRRDIEEFLKGHEDHGNQRFLLGFDFDEPTRLYIRHSDAFCGAEKTLGHFPELEDANMDRMREILEEIGEDEIMKRHGFRIIDYADEGFSTVWEK